MPMQFKHGANTLFYTYLCILFSTSVDVTTFENTDNIEDVNTIDHSGCNKIYLGVDEGNNNKKMDVGEFFIINSYSDMFIDETSDIFEKNNSRDISADECEKDFIYLIKFKENEKENIKFFVKRGVKRIDWNGVKINDKIKIILMGSLFLKETDHGNVFVPRRKSNFNNEESLLGVFEYLDEDIVQLLREIFNILFDFAKEIQNEFENEIVSLFAEQETTDNLIFVLRNLEVQTSESLTRRKTQKNITESKPMSTTIIFTTPSFKNANYLIYHKFEKSLKISAAVNDIIECWVEKLHILKETSKNELCRDEMLALTKIEEDHANKMAGIENHYLITLVYVNKICVLLRESFTEKVVLKKLTDQPDAAEKK
jgi:hypothetical protein